MELQAVDPAVSRAKFDREISNFRALETDYRRRGWLLLDVAFPNAFVVMAAPQLNPPAIVTGVLFDYTNYDARPPSVRLVDPFTREPYPARKLPTGLNRGVRQPLTPVPDGPHAIVPQSLMQAYDPDEVPFLCLPGVREYHDHPGHSGDAWELHRPSGAGAMVRLLDVIHKYGVAAIHGWGVTLVPQVSFGWVEPAPL